MPVEYGGLPFSEQIDFFKQKLDLPTNRWSDIYTREHDFAFAVAGATKRDLLADLHQAVRKGIEQGTTLDQFRKDFDEIVARRGWTGWTGEGSKAGRAWRTRVIYETNLRTSYAAGRYQQGKDQANNRPYWRYRHSPAVEDPRQLHLSWDGMVLRHDDPWWDSRYPPNGWGCQCFVETLRPEQVPDGPDAAPDDGSREVDVPGQGTREVPEGVDPGFEYAPGQARRLASTRAPQDPPALDDIPTRTPAPGDALPTPRSFTPPDDWPGDDAADEDHVRAFLGEFGATLDQPARFTDAAGEALLIGKELFIQRRNNTWKVGKGERHQQLPMLAELLRRPDEIWARMERHRAKKKWMVRRRYIARFQVAGATSPALAVFEEAEDGWWGRTIHPGDEDYVERSRGGVRLYKREE